MFKKSLLFLASFLLTTPLFAQSLEKAINAWTLPWDPDWVTAVAFAGNDRMIAGNNLGDIVLWKIPENPKDPAPEPIRRLVGHTNVINRLIVTPDQRWLISASNDRSIRYWDLNAEAKETTTIQLNGRTIDDLKKRKASKIPALKEVKLAIQQPTQVLAGHKEWVLGLSLTKDGKTLVSGDDKGEVIVWDREAGKEIRRWKLKGWVWGLGVHPELKALAISERIPLVFDSGRHTAVKIHNPETGEIMIDLTKEFKETICAAAYSPDGKYLALARGGESDGMSGKVFLLDPMTGKKIRECAPGHLSGATDLCFHPDGKHILSSGRDTTVKVWNLETGKLVKELGTPRGGQFKDWIHSVAVSPDGKWCAGGDMAGQVQVWNFPN